MAYLWMLCSALAFATMGAMAHSLRAETTWQVIAFARSVVVLLLIAGLVGFSGVKIHFWRPWELWARSVAGSVSMLFVFFSLTRLPVSIVVTLMNLAPAWVAIASWFLFPEARSKSVWVAIGVGLVGVVLIQQPQLAAGNLAVLAPLAASFLLAIVMISLHQVQEIDTRAVVLHFAIISVVVSLAAFGWSWTSVGSPRLPEGAATWVLLGTGVAATLGQLFLTKAFASGPPAKVSVVGLTQVGFAMLYDTVIGGHGLEPISAVGIALVVAPTGWLLYVERRASLVEE